MKAELREPSGVTTQCVSSVGGSIVVADNTTKEFRWDSFIPSIEVEFAAPMVRLRTSFEFDGKPTLDQINRIFLAPH